MKRFEDRALRLALPFTILGSPDAVRLVAGEEFRYTLSGARIGEWLPGVLGQLDGSRTIGAALANVAVDVRDEAANVLADLYGERVLVDADAVAQHRATRYRAKIEGQGALYDAVAVNAGAEGDSEVVVLCQDRLAYAEALAVNRRCLAEKTPWIWATTGPLGRGYVGPVFLPGVGPCFGCLLAQFRRLSPAAEFYDLLAGHERAGGRIEPTPFSAEGVAALASLVAWKIRVLGEPEPQAAIYHLHVLEAATFEVGAHAVALDLECAECEAGR